MYRYCGFRIPIISLDGDFWTTWERICEEAHMDMNPVAVGEHAPVIECHIRHLKEGDRCIYQILPFDKKRKLPDFIVIDLFHVKTFFKNGVPALDGISDFISPREMITQQRINYNLIFPLIFGQYVQTHEEHEKVCHATQIGRSPHGQPSSPRWVLPFQYTDWHNHRPKPLDRMPNTPRRDRQSKPPVQEQ